MGRIKHKDNKLHRILTLLLILCLITTYINLGFAIPNTFAWAEDYIEAEDTDDVDIEDEETTDETSTIKDTLSSTATTVSDEIPGDSTEGHSSYTVLYTSGLFVINQPVGEIGDSSTITAKWDPLGTKSYSFYDNTTVLWREYRAQITSVKFGSSVETPDQKVQPTSMAAWFYNCNNLSSFDSTNLDTSNVTNMSYTFYGAGYSVKSFNIDLSSWNTGKVSNMEAMFYNVGYSASSWSIGDISGWDTSEVTNMSEMFSGAGCMNETFILNLANWDTSSVINMSGMFSSAGVACTTFSLDVSNWKTGSVTDMSHMFSCAGSNATNWSLTGLSGWDTSKVTNMSYMFSEIAGYNALNFSLDLSGWDTSKVTDMSWIFSNAGGGATTWSITGLETWDTSSVTDMSYMFFNAGMTAENINIDLSTWKVGNVTNMSNMFQNFGKSAWKVTIGTLTTWETGSVTDMTSMFNDFAKLAKTATDIGLFNIPNNAKIAGFAENACSLSAEINISGTVSSDTNSFKDAATTKVENIYISEIILLATGEDATSVANKIVAAYGIAGTSSEGNIHLPLEYTTVLYSDGLLVINQPTIERDKRTASGTVTVSQEWAPLTTSNPYVFSSTSAVYWFANRAAIKYVKFGSIYGITKQKVYPTSMAYWFCNHTSLVDFSSTNLDTSNVTDMKYLFGRDSSTGGATSAEKGGSGDTRTSINLDLSGWNTSNVTNMSYMFRMVGAATTSLNITGLADWDVSKVTNFSYMFEWFGFSSSINASMLDISNWQLNTDSSASVLLNGMFQNAFRENTGEFNFTLNWDTSRVTNMQEMFSGTGRSASTWSLNGIENWNVSNVTSMAWMFSTMGQSANSVYLDLSNWRPAKCTNMSTMFSSAALKASAEVYIDISGWTLPASANLTTMFSSSGTAASTYTIKMNNWTVNNNVNMTSMFSSAGLSAATVTLEMNDFTAVSAATFTNMFLNFGKTSTKAVNIQMNNFIAGGTATMGTMFQYAGYSAPTVTIQMNDFTARGAATMTSMFQYAGQNATTFNMEMDNLSVAGTATMTTMFQYAGQNATTFNMSAHNLTVGTSTTMSQMFNRAGEGAGKATNKNYNTALTDTGEHTVSWNIDGISTWNVSKVISMDYMFQHAAYYSQKLELDISSWDVSRVTNMQYMFDSFGSYSYEVNIGDLKNWNTNAVTNMNYTFSSFAKRTDEDTDIGSFKIPSGASIAGFACEAWTLSAKITISVSSGTSAFLNAGKKKSGDVYLSDIMLIPTSDTIATNVTTNFINVYGVSGTSSQGNIHLPYLDFEIKSTTTLIPQYNADMVLQPGSFGGGVITIINRSEYCQINATVTATAAEDSSWTLVSQDTDFVSMAANTKQVALSATTNGSNSVDLSNSSLQVLLRENTGTDANNFVTLNLIGRTSLFNKAISEAETFCVITIACARTFGN